VLSGKGGEMLQRSSAELFSVRVSPDGAHGMVLVVEGELDMVTAKVLTERAEAAMAKNLVIDLAGVTFMDSTGLRALWTLRQSLASRGGQALLRSPSYAVMRILQTTQLDKNFDYVDGEV
jgi:anti-anti-sigma factor